MIPNFGMAGTEPTLADFAKRQRLRTRRDTDCTTIIPGRLGHIFEYDLGQLGMLVMPNPPRRQYWGFARQRLIAAGFQINQDGDGEGSAIFDPGNRQQAELAIRLAGIKRRRTPSPTQLLTARR